MIVRWNSCDPQDLDSVGRGMVIACYIWQHGSITAREAAELTGWSVQHAHRILRGYASQIFCLYEEGGNGEEIVYTLLE